MGDSKVTKAEIFELARTMAQDVNAANQRTHGLAFTLDCLMVVLDTRLKCEGDPLMADLVKAEIQRRIEAAKAKPTEPVAPPPKPALVCECCKTTVNVVEDGLYGVYCNPCLLTISTGTGPCTHEPVEQMPLISVP